MGCKACIRILFFFINFIFWLSGGAILGLGVYILVSDEVSDYTNVIRDDVKPPLSLLNISYILIGFGIFVFLVGFFGCCGAIRNNICFLSLYIVFMIVVMGGEIAVGTLVVIYRNKIKDEFKSQLKTDLQTKYGTMEFPLFNRAWDSIQYKVKCCGVDGPSDYLDTTWSNMTDKNVSSSCCVMSGPKKEPVSKDKCQHEGLQQMPDTDYVHSEGCFGKLENWFYQYTTIFIGVGFGLACLEIIGVVISIFLCTNVRKKANKHV